MLSLILGSTLSVKYFLLGILYLDSIVCKRLYGPVEYKDHEEKKKLRELKEQKERRQLTMEETRVRVKVWDTNNPKAERIHRKIAEMMALDYQPLSVITDVGFT